MPYNCVSRSHISACLHNIIIPAYQHIREIAYQHNRIATWPISNQTKFVSTIGVTSFRHSESFVTPLRSFLALCEGSVRPYTGSAVSGVISPRPTSCLLFPGDHAR